jgi:hypothetical protein
MTDWPALATVCSLLAGAVLAHGPAAQAVGQIAQGVVGSAVGDVIQALRSAAKDKLLVKDLLGVRVTDPGESTIGTVKDFVAILGGRIVAATISRMDKKAGHIPVPPSVAKVGIRLGSSGWPSRSACPSFGLQRRSKPSPKVSPA